MGFIKDVDDMLIKYSDRNYLIDHDGNRTLTYGQFNMLSGKVSEKLLSMGIKEGDAVIICIGRCAEYPAAEYGIMRIGAVAIPIIPEYPQARIDYIKNDADVKMVITEDFFADIDAYTFNTERMSADHYGVDKDDSSRRLMIYTSGSTGNPKGVVFHDCAIISGIKRSLLEEMRKLDIYNYAGTATMSFVVAVIEYYRAMLVGGTIHMISDDTRKDVQKLQDYYEKNRITLGFISPRMLRVYKNRDDALRIVMTGSERVVNSYSDDYIIFNNYGQTETCAGFCSFKIDKLYENTPVGIEVGETSIKIVDENGNELPQGKEGFIIATGYFPYEYNNLPDQTAKTFTRHENGMVSVNTGDIGKILPDGNLLFVNRKDWMLKVHGQRVEPGEIEAAMNAVNGVTNSVVKGFEQDDGSMLLCGFYTGNSDNETIKKAIEKVLPHYMIPGTFVKLDRFPVNPNGKIDRTALKKPDLSVNLVEYEAPLSELEEKICKAMEKILSIPRIGRNDDFYLVGGNSLNAVALCAECEVEGLSPSHIMLGKTPKGIAEQYSKNSGTLKPELSKKYEIQREYPLTLSNKYNFFDCEKIGETIDLMDLRAFYELDSQVDIPKLKKAIEDSLRAHPVYGIRFSKDRNIIRQTQYEAVVSEIHVSPESFEQFRRDKAAAKRDLENDRMFDIDVIHVGSEKTFLYMNMTHQIFDGASIALLQDEISDRYEGKQPKTEEFDIFDVSKYESELQKSEFYDDAWKFFDSEFKDLEEKPLGDTAEHLDSAVRRLTNIDFAAIGKDDFLRKHGISEITYIQGALCLALKKVINRDNLTYKVLHSGRDTISYSNIHGSIARGVYVLAKAKDGMTVLDFLNGLQESYQNSVYYDVIPMQEISEKYPNVDSEIYLNFRGKRGMGFHLGNKMMPFLPIGYFFDGKHIEALLNFQIDELPNGQLNLNIGAGFYTKEKTERIADAFEKAMELIVCLDNIEEIIKRI